MVIARHKWLVVMIGFVGAALLLSRSIQDTAPLASGLAAAAAMIATMLFAVLDWPSHDEAAQAAHRVAWFWGATLGAVISAAVLAVLRGAGSAGITIAYPPSDPLGYISLGVIATLLCQFACYLVAWAGWWISKR